MGTPPVDRAHAAQFIAAVEDALKAGHKPPGVPVNHRRGERRATRVAADRLGIPRGSVHSHYEVCVRALGREPDWSLWPGYHDARERPKPRLRIHADGHREYVEPPPPPATADDIVQLMRRRPVTVDEIARLTQTARRDALALIDEIRAGGVNVIEIGGGFAVARALAPAWTTGALPTYVSRPDNTYLFGALGDSHLGSKYERLDVLNDLYDRYAAAGVDRVFHTGNWIDGVMNRPDHAHDLKVHGLEPQLAYMAETYPRRDGIVTYAVAGEDHEGWFARREGIDVGRRAEQTMREAGRDDWVNLGFMEAHVRLVNANTGREAILAVVHPGGGTAYALSYSVQKIIEALEGGEKPAVGLYGHYHKLWAGTIRNVWVVVTGCQQDQTVFTRNKIKQEVHVGGTLVRLEQDPESGAIIGCAPQLIRYFARGFYNNRWSKSGPVTLPPRSIL